MTWQFFIFWGFIKSIDCYVIQKKKVGISMPEVQNIGAADYAQYPQYQEQYSVPEDLQAQEIYDPAIEEKKEASKGRLGATILAATIGAVIGGLATHHFSAKGAKNALKTAEGELEALKNSEAVKNYDSLKKATDEIHEVVGEKSIWKKGKTYYNPFSWNWNPKKWFKSSKIRDILNPIYKDAEKTAANTEAAAEGVENAAENAARIA